MKYSCITVTQSSRIKLFERAVISFTRQEIDHSQAELVVVHDDGLECTDQILSVLEKYHVTPRIIESKTCPLGALRNTAIAQSTGEYICQWDDDDLFHPDRLRIQSTPLINPGYSATTLAEQILWFMEDKSLYIRRGGVEGIHGTIMFRRNCGIEYNPNLPKGEDSEFMSSLTNTFKNGVFRIENSFHTYVRTYHNKNTWNYQHHLNHTKNAYGIEWLMRHKKQILETLTEFGISSVFVRDSKHAIAYAT